MAPAVAGMSALFAFFSRTAMTLSWPAVVEGSRLRPASSLRGNFQPGVEIDPLAGRRRVDGGPRRTPRDGERSGGERSGGEAIRRRGDPAASDPAMKTSTAVKLCINY
jgi:hypothetical protein